MQQESSSLSTPSICLSLSLVRDFLGRRAFSPCPGTLVIRFQITTESALRHGNFPLGSQQTYLRQDSASGRISDCEFDATDASIFCFDLLTPWPLSTNLNTDSLWRLSPRELLSPRPRGRNFSVPTALPPFWRLPSHHTIKWLSTTRTRRLPPLKCWQS